MSGGRPGAISRRHFLLTAGLAAAFPGLAGASASATTRADREDLALWYRQPANTWVEALPVGNGRLGAMCFGRIAQERIQLNEDTLYAGGPYSPDNPAALAALPRIRALIARGEYHAASDLAGSAMIAVPGVQMPYGAAGDLLLDFVAPRAATGYRRSLELRSALATSRFSSAGTLYTREVFSSAPDQLIVIRLTAAGPGTLDFDVGYRHPREVKYGAYENHGKPLASDTVAPGWDVREDLERAARPGALRIGPDGDAALLIEGRNIASAGIDAALRYAVRVRALGDGAITARDDRLEIRGARSITLLVAAATSYVNFRDTSGDPLRAVRQHTDAGAAKGWAALRRDHVAAHSALFDRFSLRIGSRPGTSQAGLQRPTDSRIASAETAPEPALAALYVQYARYLLLASSRAGSQPANLQGIWNEGTNPPWGSKYTININTEMNYWPAEPANLAACVEPLVAMVEELAVSGAATARNSYGARGWVAHHNTDLWRAAAPIDGPLWGMWPCGGAWLCLTLWDHYDYQPDPAYLRRIYPLLKGATLFFLDALVDDAQGRGLVTSPSISPEREHHPGVAVCAGPAIDRQILRDLFAHTLKAHALLGETDQAFASAVRSAQARLPADRIGAQGQLQEWLDDWDGSAPDPQHRHVSHLYGVYPSSQINVRDTPALIEAAKTTLNLRGDKSTGWATAWRLALWARIGDGDRAHSILLGLLGPTRTYPNMFDAHPPFQIDGNFGGAAGILEMLAQSWGGELHVLPALPSAWPEGALHGLRARGGIELDLAWSGGRLARLTLRGKAGSVVAVRYLGQLRQLTLDRDGIARLGDQVDRR
jgi:alpha-L-fucosidase 2